MGKCKLYEILFNLFPVKSWQDFIIRHHFDGCPSCQKRLALVDEVRSVLLATDKIKNIEDFWPEFTRSVKEGTKKEKFILRPLQRWAYGAVALIAVIIAGAWFMFIAKPAGVSDFPERFKINYIRIEDKPARAYLFQPKDSNTIFVWAEKDTEGE